MVQQGAYIYFRMVFFKVFYENPDDSTVV